MNGCPNVNLPEWKALVNAVGEFEAMKSWMQYEDILPVDVVLDNLKTERFYQQKSDSVELSKLSKQKIDNLQNTIDFQLLSDSQDESLNIKGGQAYVFLNTEDAKRFTFLLEKHKEFPKEFKVSKRVTKYERIEGTTAKFNSYNEYRDFIYEKSNKNKKSNLYNIIDKNTGEVLAEKVRVLHVSKDAKSKIAESYGLEFKPTKVFSANRSIAFALYRQKPSKAKYIAQAKRYLYDAIKFLKPDESLKINLDIIENLLEAFPEEMWDYINTTYSPEDSTNINASTYLQNAINFKLPKLGLLKEIEKITGIKLEGASFLNYDRSGTLSKVLRIEWKDIVVIDPSVLTTKQLKAAISYYLRTKKYFKPSSEEENVRKYAEHRGINYEELRKLVFGSIDDAIENIAYNQTGNSDEMEVSKWRQSIREYDWQTVELYSLPREKFLNTVKERITQKFKDKTLSNGISHLDYFFSGNFNWVNINFNNISGQYYFSDMETEAPVGVLSKMGGIINPFEMKIYQKPRTGETFLREEEVFNRLAAILHEPFHALHALSYGTTEEKELRAAFDRLYRTDFGKQMMEEVFGSGYNNKDISYDTLYKEFTAFTSQLMLYPKNWIKRTDLRSNDIYDFIEKITTLQDKTYKEIVKTKQKVGEIEKELQEEEKIKLTFLEKLYNYMVKALAKVIPLSKKFFSTIAETQIVNKKVVEDVFGELEEEVTKTLELPKDVKKAKEEFLTAMEDLKSAINTLMQIDSELFSSNNIINFFTKEQYRQETGREKIDETESLQSDEKGGNQLSELYAEINELPTFTEILYQDYPTDALQPDSDAIDQTNGSSIITSIADMLSGALNVPYRMVSEQEAYDLTQQTTTPYAGQPAFYYNGVAYFVKGKVKAHMVFHEFAHPLVSAIRLTNPTLYNKLLKEFLSTPEGQQIEQAVRDKYKWLENLDESMTDEIVVRAIEMSVNNLKKSTGFAKFLKEVMYAIKQLLRKVFGQKASVEKLSGNTTMMDLAQMLVKGKKIEFNLANSVSQKDIVEYYEDMSSYIDDMTKVAEKDFKPMQEIIDMSAENMLKHMSLLKKNNNLKELAELLKNEFGENEYKTMLNNLSRFSNVLNERASVLQKDINYMRNASTALLNSLLNLDVIVTKIEKHLASMDINDRATLGKASYYKEVLDDWSKFIEEGKNFLSRNRAIIGRDHPVANIVNRISTTIEDSKKAINKIDFEGMKDILTIELNQLMENTDKRYKEIFDHLTKIGAPESQFKKWEAEYAKVKLTPQKIQETLKGKLGDANPLNAFLEGYLYSSDPVIGGFASFVKNNLTDYMLNAQAKHYAFVDKIMPALEKWGDYNPKRPGELGEKVGFLDKIGIFDPETGEFKMHEVWSLLSFFKDYRYDIAKYKHEIEELTKEYASKNSKESRDNLIKKKYEYKKLLRDYFHQEFIPKYYERLDLLDKDDIGIELASRMDQIFFDMSNLLEPSTSQEDLLKVMDQVGRLWRDYYRLGSETDIKGNMKTGMDLDVAKRMQEFKAAAKDLYDFIPKDRAFADAYERYEQEIVNKYTKSYKGAVNFKNSPEFQSYMNDFIKRNTRTVINKQFWEDRQALYRKIASILEGTGNADIQKQIDETRKFIADLTAGFKDEDNQFIATEMTEDLIKKVKENELKLQSLKEQLKASRKGKLNRSERKILQALLEELDDMQKYEATDYYIDTINEFLLETDSPLMLKLLKTNEVDKDTVEILLSKGVVLKELFDKNPEFKKWFNNNHIITQRMEAVEVTDPETGEQMEVLQSVPYYKRIMVWSNLRPKDEAKYLESFTFTRSDGTPVTITGGVPSLRFYNRVVKDEYRTGYDFKTGEIKLIVGVHVDNKDSRPNLPRLDVADKRYINQRYLDLRNAPAGSKESRLYDVLEIIKEYHLQNQDGLERNKKLFYDFPRHHKNTLEMLQTRDLFQKKWSAWTLIFRRAADFFRKAKDDPDSGLNPEDTWNLVRADAFDEQAAQIPMTGLFALDPEQVSTDILLGVSKYMLAAERNKKLVELSPYAQAMKSVLKDPENRVKDLTKVVRFDFLYRGLLTFLNKKGESVREKAILNFIEREFEGITNTGLLSGNAFANKLSNMMFRRASFGFFALNFPSALKNQLGAKFQGLISAAGGKHFNLRYFLAAEPWSLDVMRQLSFNIYERGQKPFLLQFVDAHDPTEGRTKEKFAENMSRTFVSDVANLSWFMNFRKWVELQASMQQFGAMALAKKVKLNGKEISYVDAWEIRDGKLQLKEGVDPIHGITYDKDGNMIVGQDFKNFRNTVQAVMRDLNGAYDEFNQPEAQRYLIFRYFSYLRKFFTTMLMTRFGFTGSVLRPLPRMNVGHNEPIEGYYISTIKWLGRSMLNIGTMMPYATPEEKIALKKLSTEIGALIAMYLLLAPLFGWDPDDEERFAKLREKSGALPFFGLTDEDPNYPFHFSGWMSNQALNLMMQVRAENEQFLPLPGFGLDDYGAFLDIKSIAAGPTLKKYGQIVTDLFYAASDDKRGFYQRDVGPYSWQKEESSKFWNHLFSSFGLTGSSLDPAVAIKNFQGIQARAR